MDLNLRNPHKSQRSTRKLKLLRFPRINYVSNPHRVNVRIIIEKRVPIRVGDHQLRRADL